MLQVCFKLKDSVPPEGNLNFLPEWKHLEISEDELKEMLMTGEIKSEIEQRIGEDTEWFKKWLPRFKDNEADCDYVT